MCDEKIISTKGLKSDAIIIDEMLFDVNTTHFEENGGYEFAKDFYKKVYDYAVDEVGGEQYILSAVMHADEKNQAVSEKLGKDIFHYHLHIIYVPTVQKEVKWTKRCKDKSLVGTTKEIITQVSHSKKWASHKKIHENGATEFVKSYSLFQDRFHDYLQKCGYKDIKRGEKGSLDENLTTQNYKNQKDIERNSEILEQQQKSINQNLEIQIKLTNIDDAFEKPVILDKNKVIVDKKENKDMKTLAKKQIINQNQDSDAIIENKDLSKENAKLKTVIAKKDKELSQYKSVDYKLNQAKTQQYVSELEKFKAIVLEFLKLQGLFKLFEEFLRRCNKDIER